MGREGASRLAKTLTCWEAGRWYTGQGMKVLHQSPLPVPCPMHLFPLGCSWADPLYRLVIFLKEKEKRKEKKKKECTASCPPNSELYKEKANDWKGVATRMEIEPDQDDFKEIKWNWISGIWVWSTAEHNIWCKLRLDNLFRNPPTLNICLPKDSKLVWFITPP